MRAASHSNARAPSTAPRGVGKPVQAFTAVNRKPTMMAAAKPKSISCACHSSGEIAMSGSATLPRNEAIHTGKDRQATSAPAI